MLTYSKLFTSNLHLLLHYECENNSSGPVYCGDANESVLLETHPWLSLLSYSNIV